MALFKLSGTRLSQLHSSAGFPGNEKGLQGIVEENLEDVFGVEFLATEYPTGPRHGGRIDSLGIDQDGSPVILEYKLLQNENVITQGLFYLDWLLDHRSEFEQLVAGNKRELPEVSWTSPRLILLASRFGRYDRFAVNRIDERIELWTYTLYEGDLLKIERLDQGEEVERARGKSKRTVQAGSETIEGHIERMTPTARALFVPLREAILDLGEDVKEKALQNYIVYSRLKRMCTINPGKDKLSVYPHGPVSEIADLSALKGKVGHTGSDYMRVSLDTAADLDKVMELVRTAYELQQ